MLRPALHSAIALSTSSLYGRSLSRSGDRRSSRVRIWTGSSVGTVAANAPTHFGPYLSLQGDRLPARARAVGGVGRGGHSAGRPARIGVRITACWSPEHRVSAPTWPVPPPTGRGGKWGMTWWPRPAPAGALARAVRHARLSGRAAGGACARRMELARAVRHARPSGSASAHDLNCGGRPRGPS